MRAPALLNSDPTTGNTDRDSLRTLRIFAHKILFSECGTRALDTDCATLCL
jgi:hypothetical protein